jgi:hypothetical protein
VIVFDLRCADGHVFEAWFGSSVSYESQRAGGLLACPICGGSKVEKAVMAPNVAAKGNRRTEVAASPRSDSPEPTPEIVKAVLTKIAEAQAASLEKSEWVGGNFATRARAMHDGDEASALIHGQATPDEARELVEDGVAVVPLLVPFVPPERRN